ncbi:HAMP domain-containing sensor histidine kinase [Brevundimonas sp.]|uniref:sensor histidine kinase n=1 Tax=Brevundimonas sp. TaxID=1871086 RepID=UPI0018202A8D|nr:HAMP domain-containing sensor histidine kinase [Brevundimonas sp.]MBA4809230.1 HAMP domain-containing histidine kinase [Brevundimonas sp.]
MRRLGLANRLTLTLVLVVVAFQAISVLGLMALQQQDQDEWRLPVPVRIAAAAAALDRTPSARRDDLLVALNGDATRFFITDGVPAGYRQRGGALPVLLRSYGAALEGRDVRLLVPEERRRFRPRFQGRRTAVYAISVALEDGQRLVVAPGLGQRRRGVAMAALVFNLLVGLAAAVLVWRTVQRATRDLQVIADASDRFAVDLGAPPMDETGHAEARRVASAFNRMRARIQALMGERMRMLAAAAHDLKTLMTRLRLRVALIEDADQRARADRDVALMATLIEDVLLVARGEERPAVLVPVDVEELLTDLVSERAALGQAVSLGRVEPGRVQGDVVALRRIVENLVENAVVYGGSAEVSFQRDDDRWRLAVVDHGPGLTAAFADRAFEPFARGEASRSRATGGSGLGLSIARSLAQQMGADIRLETTPGGGVTALVLFRIG